MGVDAIPIKRGCGTRVAGGCYWELGIGPDGRPVEDFLLDPPICLLPDLRIPTRGVIPIEHDGVTHLIDRVGAQFYPNVADFVEEVRRFGLSRRLPKSLAFARLTCDSRLLLIHDRAWVTNIADYRSWMCRTGNAAHTPGQHPEMCIGVWWEDLAPISKVEHSLSRDCIRCMPSFTYTAHIRPAGVTPIYQPAFFASFPCSRLVVVRGDGHEQTLERMRQARLTVDLVNQ
jgi:hypothetical protein